MASSGLLLRCRVDTRRVLFFAICLPSWNLTGEQQKVAELLRANIGGEMEVNWNNLPFYKHEPLTHPLEK